MKNLINVNISVPNESVLNIVSKTPSFQRLTKLKLRVGDNIETVNNFQYSEQYRMFPIIGVVVTKIIKH